MKYELVEKLLKDILFGRNEGYYYLQWWWGQSMNRKDFNIAYYPVGDYRKDGLYQQLFEMGKSNDSILTTVPKQNYLGETINGNLKLETINVSRRSRYFSDVEIGLTFLFQGENVEYPPKTAVDRFYREPTIPNGRKMIEEITTSIFEYEGTYVMFDVFCERLSKGKVKLSEIEVQIAMDQALEFLDNTLKALRS